jgi:hypothetical protein
MEMHERRGAERKYTCNECGEVFRNILPFQAHQRDVHQVGGGKRAKTSTWQDVNLARLLTLYLNRYFFSFKNRQDLRHPLTKVSIRCVFSVAI